VALPLEPGQIGGASEHHLEAVEVQGREVEIEGPALHRGERIRPVGIAPDGDHLGVRRGGQALCQPQSPSFAVLGRGGRPRSSRDHDRGGLAHSGQGPGATSRQGDLILALEGIPALGPDFLVVFHDEQPLAVSQLGPPAGYRVPVVL